MFAARSLVPLIIAGVLGALLALGASPRARAQTPPAPRIGVVDLRKVLDSSREYQTEKQASIKRMERSQRELEAHRAEYTRLKAEIDARAKKASKAELEALNEQHQSKAMQLQALQTSLQRDLQRDEEALERRFRERLHEVARQLGAAGGFSLIVDRSEAGVLFLDGALDLTEQLAARFEATSVKAKAK